MKRRLAIAILFLVGLVALTWLALIVAPEPSPPNATLRVDQGTKYRMTTSTYCWKAWNGAVCADTFGLPCRGRRSAVRVDATKGDTLHFRFQFEPNSKPLLQASTLDNKGNAEHPSKVELNLNRSPHPSWKLEIDPPIQIDVFAASERGDVSYVACIT